MKRIWIFILLLGVLSSCNDFLDVTSDTELVEEDLYSDITGVRMAVNGVYKSLSSTDLYGKNLTWGFASAIGHNYQTSSTTYLPTSLYYAAQFDWENAETVTEQIWSKAYNTIAACNDIIQHVEGKDTTFFELGSIEKDMILGEMYGVRAMLHFDIYRLFAPAPVTNYAGTTIPYVTTYPDHQPVHKTAEEVETLIIEDMERAKALLTKVDTVFCVSWCKSTSARLRHSNSWSSAPPNDFFSYRGHRMNYWGATALLARMYLYLGDQDNAYKNAWICYRFHQRNWFKWTSASYLGLITDKDYVYPKKPDEIFMAFSNNNNYDNWESTIGTSNYAFRMKNMTELFKGDEDDYRLVGYYNRYGYQRYLTWIRPAGTSYTATSTAENQGPYLPIISFPEMYHILIECMINKNQITEAVGLLNTIRQKRGAKTTIPETIAADQLKERLVTDIIRETLTMGQTFYMFKRLNRDIFNGEENIKMSSEKWTIPLPQSETDYQF
ncbi:MULTISPECIES: RagB/SusD family nutrient uptake outer membrane protein [Sanguibacteroides]|uniref:SusD-like N-terminal domain-containing protein n=1 Tax=Sanguibacteroides justesenii TaxID=1547597 RepID=A0A0C3R498_9PORP|nr:MULTISPECIES: RagB/SusD family nutrient uptake outer membrane protein [Sanguibacteroides]KIO44205.1 hypothetical protein BA92_12620 [Sanguibacteroides justesenii]